MAACGQANCRVLTLGLPANTHSGGSAMKEVLLDAGDAATSLREQPPRHNTHRRDKAQRRGNRDSGKGNGTVETQRRLSIGGLAPHSSGWHRFTFLSWKSKARVLLGTHATGETCPPPKQIELLIQSLKAGSQQNHCATP